LKYSNVSIVEKFYPMLGDIAFNSKNERANKFRQQHYIDATLLDPNIDILLAQFGPFTKFDM